MQLMAGEPSYIKFLLTLCDFAVLCKHVQLRDSVRSLLRLLPTGKFIRSPVVLLYTKQIPNSTVCTDTRAHST